jgi:uncharacterized membrane protein
MHFVYIVEPDSSTVLLWAHLFIIIVLAMVLAPVAGWISEKVKRKNQTALFFVSWAVMIVLAKIGVNWLITHL